MINNQQILVYDIEIAREVESVKGKWGNPFGMGLGSCVVYSYIQDKYFFFLHEESRGKLLQLLNGNICVSFNGVNFDSKCLLGNDRKIISNKITGIGVSNNKYSWMEYDIFLEVLMSHHKTKTIIDATKKRSNGGMNLDAICEKTLGRKKNGNGAIAPKLYQAKKYDELFEYNYNDVTLTKSLLDFIIANGFVRTKNEKSKRLRIKNHNKIIQKDNIRDLY